MMLQLFLLSVVVWIGCEGVYVSFNHTHPLHYVRDTYLSFNIDAGYLYNNLDFTDPYLRTLVRNLAEASPMQLRVGGTAADDIVYTGAGGQRGNCSVTTSEYIICVDN